MISLIAALQLSVVPQIDPAQVATKAEVAAIIVPPVCVAPPAPDTLTGSAGTGAACTPRTDASSATQVQRKAVVTAADGTFSGTWDTAWSVAPATVVSQANTTAGPYNCQVGAWTVTTFSGRCWRLTATTLPATLVALGGMVIAPFVPAESSVPVSVVGRQ